MKKLSLLSYCIILLFSCSEINPYQKVYQTKKHKIKFYDNGDIEEIIQFKDGVIENTIKFSEKGHPYFISSNNEYSENFYYFDESLNIVPRNSNFIIADTDSSNIFSIQYITSLNAQKISVCSIDSISENFDAFKCLSEQQVSIQKTDSIKLKKSPKNLYHITTYDKNGNMILNYIYDLK